MKQFFTYLKVLLFFAVFAFGISSVKAQTTDTTNVFDPALVGTEIVYAGVSYIDVNNNGQFDASFNLSDTPISAWGDYATAIAFYDDRITVRAENILQPVDSLDYVVVPVANQFYHIWTALDVPNMKYYVYVQTNGMAQPELIYSKGGDFRKQSTEINRWQAIHNPDAQPDYLNVANVTVVDAVGIIPQEIIDGMSDPSLATLTTSIGELNPAFDPFTTDYQLAVPYGTSEVIVNAEANGLGASVSMFDDNSVELTDGVVAFNNEGNGVEVIVTTLTGEEATYYIAIFVDEGQDDPTLSAITSSVGAVDPAFSPEVTDYTILVPQGTQSIDLTAMPNFPQADVQGAGTINLTNGTGSATIIVTSYDESANKTYNVTVEETDGGNYAMYLPGVDGNTSNIDISGLDLSTLPVTIEMWVMPEGTQAYNAGLFFNRPSNTGLQYASSWWGEAHAVRIMANANEGEIYSNLTTVSPVTPGLWHHIAIIIADSTRMAYLNGESLIENDKFTAIDWSAGKLYIGWDSENPAKAFKGYIDEVRVWSDSLTAEELNANKLEVLAGNEENLVAYYNFDIPNSAYAIDATSNAHNGIITGGTYAESFSRADIELTSLAITGYNIYPEFTPRNTNYSVIFPAGTQSFEITAEANNSAAEITGTGTINITNEKDSAIVTVTESGESMEYVIRYVVDTELTLKHSYTFADGTAKDVVGGADGVVNGGVITDGTFTSTEEGDYITLPAAEIAINEYPSFSIEAFITQGLNDGYSMLTYFGDLKGVNSAWLQLSRTDDLAHAEMKTGAVDNVVSIEPGYGENHHYVWTVNSDSMTLYVDGFPIDTMKLSANNVISGISNANAWIGYGGWSDPTYMGTIYELNIYAGTMSEEEIAFKFLNFPTEDSTSDATLSELFINSTPINDFKPYTLAYDSILDMTPDALPVITATAANTNAEVVITDITELPGTATVVVTSEDGEYTNTYSIKLSGPTPAKIQEEASFKVYPTRSNGSFTVETVGGETSIEIFSITGRLITRTMTSAVKSEVAVPAQGIYLIRVNNNKETETFKVIKY